MKHKRKSIFSRWAWGIAFLLVAALLVVNYLGFGFGVLGELSFWSIIFAALAVIVLVSNIASLSIASLPLPLAALYYIFQTPLGWPQIGFWPLALVTLLLICGLHILLPRKFRDGDLIVVNMGGKNSRKRRASGSEDSAGTTVDDGDPNNPYIGVSFGSATRYLHADCLQSAELYCGFGGMEVYFDNVQLSPEGADVNVSCRFGGVEIFVPSHWRVINDMSATVGSAEVSRKLKSNDENAPTIRLTGHVSFGGVDVSRIKD